MGHMDRSLRNLICRGHFSPSIIWVLGIKHRSAGLDSEHPYPDELSSSSRLSFEAQLVTNTIVKLSCYFSMCVLSLRQKGVGLNSEHPKKSSSALS